MNKKNLSFLMIGTLIYGILGCEEGELDPNKAGLLVPKTVVENSSLPSIKVNNILLHAELERFHFEFLIPPSEHCIVLQQILLPQKKGAILTKVIFKFKVLREREGGVMIDKMVGVFQFNRSPQLNCCIAAQV